MFADTIRETRARLPACRIEVLIPDFQGNEARAARRARRAARRPEPQHGDRAAVVSHGALGRPLRADARAARPVAALRAGHSDQDRVMVGLGEEHDELVATFKDLREVGCGILTIGQYLRPSAGHAPMVRYYHPDEFADLKAIALELGFVHVESGPLVRSSYHAHETADAYQRAAGS